MTKIKQNSGRKDDLSAYSRVFGHAEIGKLFSRVHATAIRAGNDLEDILINKAPHKMEFSDFEVLLQNSALAPAFSQSSKLVIYKLPKIEKRQGDLLIFDNPQKKGLVIEVKEGDTFDTKKSSGELESLAFLANYYTQLIGYKVDYAFSSFYVPDRQAIVVGTKSRFDVTHALTGRELCKLIDISFEEVVEERKEDQKYNLEFFLREMLKMSDIRLEVNTILKEINP